MKKNTKRYNHGFKIIKKYKIEKIFDILDKNDDLPNKLLYSNIDYNDSLRRAKILKELIERDGCECKHCKKKPSFFALGKDVNGYFHLDLYTYKNKEPYMFTIDHVYPRSKGGEDTIDNYQLLCKVCNEDKGDITDEKETYIDKTTSSYLNKKIKALDIQLKAMLNKMKRCRVTPLNKSDGLSSDKEYEIVNIELLIDDEFNTNYIFTIINDYGEEIETNLNDFITKKD